MINHRARMKLLHACLAFALAAGLLSGAAVAQPTPPYLDSDPASEPAFPAINEPLAGPDTRARWSPFDFLRISAGVNRLDNGHLSLLSSRLGTDSLGVKAYVRRLERTPARQALTECGPLSALNPGCAPWQTGLAGSSRLGLTAQWSPWQGVSLGLGYYQRRGIGPASNRALAGVLNLLSPGWYNGAAGAWRTSARGLNLDMSYGLEAGFLGTLEFELSLTQQLNRRLVLSGQLHRMRQMQLDPLTRASFGFSWERGDFSGRVSSHYVDNVFINGRLTPASWTTVDISFSWETPWDASLSVGAKNVLGNEPNAADATDPFPFKLDDAFTRIPYVRYEQDL